MYILDILRVANKLTKNKLHKQTNQQTNKRYKICSKKETNCFLIVLYKHCNGVHTIPLEDILIDHGMAVKGSFISNLM